MSSVAVGFLHPALLWALPLAAVPVIIHLLNRRRFRTVRWAAMEQLLAAMKRNRRRIRLEHWLVLLLRTLAVVLLVMLVSRPRLSGAMVLGNARVHHVVCLDDSASMAHRRGLSTSFAAALEQVVGLAEDLAETRSGDLFTLLRASRAATPGRLALNTTAQLGAEVREMVAELRVGDDVADLGALLERVRECLAAVPEASRAEIYLVTDLRSADWLTASGELRPEVLRELRAVDSERQRLTVISVSSADTENLGVVDLRSGSRIAAVGVPVQLVAEVTNHGDTVSAPTQLAFEVDGKSRVLRSVEALGPGETRVVGTTHTFAAAGFHGVTAALPGDGYVPDDTRALALEVVESSHVLLVDGDPGERPEEAETYFLAAALDLPRSGIEIEVIPDHMLPDHDLSAVDMIYLCNVPAPAPDTVVRLESYVASGGGLVITLGNQVDPGRYDEALFRAGAGLLPAELTELAGDLDRPEHVFVDDVEHPALRVATTDLEQVFGRLVLVGRYFRVVEDADTPTRVLLRVGGGAGAPLMLSRHFGGSGAGGEVVLITTTVDAQWTNWPRWAPFLIVAQELQRALARAHDGSAFNLSPAGVLRTALDPGRYRPDVVVRSMLPDREEHTFSAGVVPEEAELQVLVEVPMRELDEIGLFELWLTPHAGLPERRLFARNPPPIEGRLHRLDRPSLTQALPEDVRDRVAVRDGESLLAASAAGSGFGEIWRMVGLVLLAVMSAESILAWRFGRR